MILKVYEKGTSAVMILGDLADILQLILTSFSTTYRIAPRRE